jgi:hypothetical protein
MDVEEGDVSDRGPPEYSNVDVFMARRIHGESIARAAPLYISEASGFVSFFWKPHLRDVALGKHRRIRENVSAWDHPVPEVREEDFDLPEEWKAAHRSKAHFTVRTSTGLNQSGIISGGQSSREFGEMSESAIPEDISSVASVEDDIFSTAGSTSTNSTVSSVRFTVIELIISKFVEDSELSYLYEEAVKRMGNARFVRNQRRLLKKFFLDLRAQTQNHLHEEAIRILRGRAERTSMAEQVWRFMNPSNPSLIADMAALKNQNPDKKMQLERLLGPQYV